MPRTCARPSRLTKTLPPRLPSAERGTGLRREVNDLLRAGLAAASQASDDRGAPYELPTFDPGSALITDPRALKDLLDDEDDERVLRRGA